jgi:hypothetical protein
MYAHASRYSGKTREATVLEAKNALDELIKLASPQEDQVAVETA